MNCFKIYIYTLFLLKTEWKLKNLLKCNCFVTIDEYKWKVVKNIMHTPSENIIIEQVDPNKLSIEEYKKIYELIQDMWAYWIGEFVQCNSCWLIHSKKDIFWNMPELIYMRTVAEIMRILKKTSFPCNSCWEPTRFIYWEEHIERIRKKLCESIDAHLTLAKQHERVVGVSSYYIARYERIFNEELTDHYSKIWAQGVSERIKQVTGELPENMVMFTAIWFLEKYRNLFHLKRFLKVWSMALKESYDTMLWIMELDTWNVMYRVFTSAGWQPLWFRWNREIINTHRLYDSELVVFTNPTSKFKKAFVRNDRSWKKEMDL